MYIMMILMLMACVSLVGSEASHLAALSYSLELVQSAGEAAQKEEMRKKREQDELKQKQEMSQARDAIRKFYEYLTKVNQDLLVLLNKVQVKPFSESDGKKLLATVSTDLKTAEGAVIDERPSDSPTLLQRAQSTILYNKVRLLNNIKKLIEVIAKKKDTTLARLIVLRTKWIEEYKASALAMQSGSDEEVLKAIRVLEEKYKKYTDGEPARTKKREEKKQKAAEIEDIRQLLISYNKYLVVQYQEVALKAIEAQENFLNEREKKQKALDKLKSTSVSVAANGIRDQIKELHDKHAAAMKKYQDLLLNEIISLQKEQNDLKVSSMAKDSRIYKLSEKLLQNKISMLRLVQLYIVTLGDDRGKLADFAKNTQTTINAFGDAITKIKDRTSVDEVEKAANDILSVSTAPSSSAPPMPSTPPPPLPSAPPPDLPL